MNNSRGCADCFVSVTVCLFAFPDLRRDANGSFVFSYPRFQLNSCVFSPYESALIAGHFSVLQVAEKKGRKQGRRREFIPKLSFFWIQQSLERREAKFRRGGREEREKENRRQVFLLFSRSLTTIINSNKQTEKHRTRSPPSPSSASRKSRTSPSTLSRPKTPSSPAPRTASRRSPSPTGPSRRSSRRSPTQPAQRSTRPGPACARSRSSPSRPRRSTSTC